MQISVLRVNVGSEKTTCLHAKKFEWRLSCMVQGKLAGKLSLQITVRPAGGCLPLGQSHITGWEDAHRQGCSLLGSHTMGATRKITGTRREMPFLLYCLFWTLYKYCASWRNIYSLAQESQRRTKSIGLIMRCKKLITDQSTTHIICFINQRIILNSASFYLDVISTIELFSIAKKVEVFFSESYC